MCQYTNCYADNFIRMAIGVLAHHFFRENAGEVRKVKSKK